jgi:iron complex outermembrane receptor protein
MGLALGSLAGSPASAQAQAAGIAESQRSYRIPAGPLERALNSFASAAGVELSVDATLIQGKTSRGLTGSFTVQEGFAELLRGQGLQTLRGANGAYSLRAAPLAAAEPENTRTMAAVTVTASAERESATGPIQGYVARRNLTATKTDTPNIETPQALSVITRDQIDDQGAAPALQDALRYTPGLIGTRGVNLTDDSFNIRGFAAGLATSSNTPVFRDGLRQVPAMYSSTVEPYGVERIDVLRGPGSVLFGQVTPGGVINVTSKRPTDTPLHEVDMQAGSFDHKQVGLDLGGPLGDSGEWSYRLTAMLRDANTQTDYIPNKREYIAPALTWRPSAGTSLTLLASYQHTRTAYNWGLPVAGSLLANPNGQLPRSRFTGEPGFDKYDTKTWSLGYLLEHRFNDTWSLRQNARYYESDMIWNSAYGSGLQAANQRLLNRFGFIRADQYKSSNVDTQLQAKWQHGAFEHTTLVGIDYASIPWVRNERRGTVAALDLFNPAYGAVVTPNAQSSRILDTDTTQTGLYLQEQLKIDKRWVLLAGLRQDWARSNISGVLTNGSANSPTSQVGIRNNVQAATGRVGAVYLFDSGLAPYVSFATSFEPESGSLDYNNNPFKPTKGRQYEAGVKYEPKDRPLSLTASVFDLRRTDVLTADPNHVGYSIQTGEISSRGLELEAKGKLGRNVELISAYTYTDARITRSNSGDQGTVPSGIPRHNLALWGVYKFSQGDLRGVKVGAGARRIIGTSGYVLGATPTPAELPAYNVVDAMVSYDTASWRLSLNINNLFDKSYIQSCYYASTSCFYGEGRSVIARATYRW